MRRLPFALPAILVLLAGCDPVSPVDPLEWQATLVGQAGFEQVTGSAIVTSDLGVTTSTVAISGATTGGLHPWHVHRGSCDDDQGIVGDATAYPHLEVGVDGTASASASVNVALEAGGSYFVNVHASPGDLATIVACGNLVAN